jgi:LuxR family glucitol operon transcriptional activator
MWYGHFLLKKANDVEGAREQFDVAVGLEPKRSDAKLQLARACLFLHEFEKVRENLDAVAGDSTALDLIYEKQKYDLTVQYHYRIADDLGAKGDYIESLNSLERMRQAFDAVPADFKDKYLRNKLAKAALSIERCKRNLPQSHMQLADEILTWLEGQTSIVSQIITDVQNSDRAEVGTGFIRRIRDGFGFITTSDGGTLYFNMSSVEPFTAKEELREGDAVKFLLGRNSRGPAAVRVRIDPDTGPTWQA